VRPFLRVVAVEVALMAVVVGVTAALVAEPPPRPSAGSVSVTSTVGPFELTLTVDPAQVGPNEIHLYVLDPTTGQPVSVDEITVAASLPSVGVGPLELATRPAGPGHALVPAARLPLPGDWRVQVAVREGEFDEWSTSFDIPIRKD
jgi:copper transport protein